MENLDSWQLVKLNAFEDACKKADSEFNKSKSIPSLRHKVMALFHLKKYQEAEVVSEEIIRLRNSETEDDFISSGIALWAMNKTDEAIKKWQQAEKAKYTDAAGGIELSIILYLGAIRTNNEVLKRQSIKNINKLLKSKKSNNWPAPLGHFILGNLSEEQLRSTIVEIPILKERQLCQADFVIGIKYLEGFDKEKYKTKLRDALSHGSPAYLEQLYYLAKVEFESVG